VAESPSELTIGPDLHGRRLDEALAALIPYASRMSLRGALDDGAVTVNGEPRPAGWRISAGDRINLLADLPPSWAMTPEPIPLTVLFEDEHLIAVDKPAGMVVHPAGRHRTGTLANALAHHLNVIGAADPPIRPGLIHRLDRATSGVMLVAKTQAALSRGTILFQNRRVRKGYLALVHGCVEAEEGEWDAPIGSRADATPKWGVYPEGRPARSRYLVRERFPEHTLLELEPLTGRTNQLRLHAAHFGHPIAGDDLFGPAAPADGERLFLHAYLLELPHPITRESFRLESPLPHELARRLDELRTPSTPG
jgi:23S rRNA pseudouridine1911/1915/1917 synthase